MKISISEMHYCVHSAVWILVVNLGRKFKYQTWFWYSDTGWYLGGLNLPGRDTAHCPIRS